MMNYNPNLFTDRVLSISYLRLIMMMITIIIKVMDLNIRQEDNHILGLKGNLRTLLRGFKNGLVLKGER